MLRRHALATLFAATPWDRRSSFVVCHSQPIAPLFDGAHGGVVLLDRKTRRVLAAHTPHLSGPPGSTLKPFVLQTLIERGRLRPDESFPCPRDLRLRGRSFACTHPLMPAPFTVRTAIAYSCSCFVAQVASRFTPSELTRELDAWGIDSPSALGDDGIATPASLAAAYLRLAARAVPSVMAGMTDAVSYGTAQRAQVPGLTIAGKTGTARHAAWFAGFTDAVVIVVLVQGRSGGADAAPIAARILQAHTRGLL